MILVADSGSTKTQWCFVDEENKLHAYKTEGINPYYQPTEKIAEILRSQLLEQGLKSQIPNSKFQIHFYGAGCSSADKCADVSEALSLVFPDAIVTVEHDMMAAA